MSIVDVSNLRKAYGDIIAVDGVSFSVEEGEIFGIIGPNGAGKTTVVECIVGLRVPDAGAIRVLGSDPRTDRGELRESVGVQLQECALPAKLRAREALDLYGSFYRRPADADQLLEVLGLTAKRHDYFKKLSGGQKQRLSIAMALIGQPKIAVLDELTTGLDPQARRDTWELIERVRDRGVTIVLVTHYMDEAERLCDRVALIESGRILAIDSPAGLAESACGGKRVRFVPSIPFEDRLLTDLPEVRGLERQGEHVVVRGAGELVNAVILTLDRAGVAAKDVELEAPSLEDAFVELTGRGLQQTPPRGTLKMTSGEGLSATARGAPRQAFWRLLRTEAKLSWRQPAGLIFGLGLPVLLLLVFANIPAFRKPNDTLGGLTFLSVYVPILMAFALASLALIGLTAPLATYREQGILRRMSTTPVPPSWVLAAQLVVNLGIAAAALLLIITIATAAFGVQGPAQVPGFILAVVLEAAALFAMGLWVAAIARTAQAAAAIGNILFFPMMFFAGLWIPRDVMPAALRSISDFTPLGAAVQALQGATRGIFPPARPLLVLLAYAAAFGILAVRSFKWE
jgi:ABC-2 type transport system ATP-binding protein